METALTVRARNRERMDRLLETHDFVLSTSIPFTAPTVQQWIDNWKDGGSFAPYYTSETFMFNWLQLPAISVPVGFHDGMQIVGLPDSEPRMIQVAHAFMQKFGQQLRPTVS